MIKGLAAVDDSLIIENNGYIIEDNSGINENNE